MAETGGGRKVWKINNKVLSGYQGVDKPFVGEHRRQLQRWEEAAFGVKCDQVNERQKSTKREKETKVREGNETRGRREACLTDLKNHQ